VLAVLFVVTLVLSGALLALVRDATQLRRTLTTLEKRIAALELESAATLVIEPSPEAETPPPRPRNALVN